MKPHSRSPRIRPVFNLLGVLALLCALVGARNAFAAPPTQASRAVNLDMLFIGAHPDDEASGLSTYGQWNEYDGVRAGVITITRGEGGGDAVGPEEGPALGLLREAEERRAVARAGITNIYNLDKVDFYYTVSSPLTEQIWGAQETLEKVVRVVRMTRPEMIVTMNPSPSPGNHGNHQYAARLAVEAFYAAADPNMFPNQIRNEGLQPWRARNLYRSGASGTGPTGLECPSTFTPTEATDNVYGIFSGRPSTKYGRTWAQVEREAQREYASQGWSVFPDMPTDPSRLACDRFTMIDSRVPFTAGNTAILAMLEGALRPAEGGLPLGTEFYLTTDVFDVTAGRPFNVVAHARNVGNALRNAAVTLELPAGWTSSGNGQLGTLSGGRERTTSFTVTPAPNAAVNTRVRIGARLQAGAMRGTTNEVVQVVPPVRGTLQPLPQVAQFREWVQSVGSPQLDNLIKPVLSLGVGETRAVRVDLRNNSDQPQSGSVALNLPAGFTADAATKPFDTLAAGTTGSVTFQVSNRDTSLKTSNEGGAEGDYNFTIATTTAGITGTQQAALNLVPVTTIPQASTAPTVDGTEGTDEYGSTSIDLSRRWEGSAPDNTADASGSAKLAWHDDALYFLVKVNDDVLGTVLQPNDAKRHWRTDSVEIAIDPRGGSENTSTTFKVGIFPTTADPANGNPAAAYRDADNRQGPAAETAPGMQVRATLNQPYTGYTLEVKIPLAVLPAALDPGRVGLNVFIYDSDTQNLTGQTRLGWSTWGGVQGDPYRWGHAALAGYTPPAGRSAEPAAPVIPMDVTRSVTSPQSIMQSATDRVPLAGGPPAPANALRIVDGPFLSGNTLTVYVRANATGKANLFAWGADRTIGVADVTLTNNRVTFVRWQLDDARSEVLRNGGMVVIGFEADRGGTMSLAANISTRR